MMMMMMIATLINTEDPPASHLPSALFVQPSAHVSAKPLQSRWTLCDPMDYSLPGSSVHEIFQQEYWSRLPRPPPGDLPDPGIKLESPYWQVAHLKLNTEKFRLWYVHAQMQRQCSSWQHGQDSFNFSKMIFEFHSAW